MKSNEGDSPVISWPHCVITLAGGLRVGYPGVADVQKCFGGIGLTEITKLPTFLTRMNGALKLAGNVECIVIPDLLEILPDSRRCRGRIWETIHDSAALTFLLLTHDPERATVNLPASWGKGFANVCIAAFLGSNIEENRRQLYALRTLPARHRGIWLPAKSKPSVPTGWHEGIGWVIADPSKQSEMMHQECKTHRIPFYVRPGGEVATTKITNDVGIPHHPFGGSTLSLNCDSPYLRMAEPKVAEQGLPIAGEDVVESAEANSHLEMSPPTETSPPIASQGRDVISNPSILDLVIDSDEETRQDRFIRLDRLGRAGICAGLEAGLAFLKIRNDELWREGGHKSWNSYCKTVLETSRNYLNRIINYAMIKGELQAHTPPLDPDGQKILPVAESQSRPLIKLSTKRKRAKAWATAVQRAGGVPTAQIVAGVVTEILGGGTRRKPSIRHLQRTELMNQLRMAVDAADSWDRVRELVAEVTALDHQKAPKSPK